MAWSQRALLIYPVAGLTETHKNNIAQAFVTHAGLETFANERLMFGKAAPTSSDWGATETHRQISTALTPNLASAVTTALTGAGGLWYLLNADTDALLSSNDPAKVGRSSINWSAGLNVAAGEVLRYEGVLYEVITGHLTAVQWPPSIVPALFKRYRPPGEVSEWVQPTMSQDSYPINARVTHSGKIWKSLIAANTTQPGTAPGAQFWLDEAAPVVGAWSGASVAYKVNDVVTYLGITYRCQIAHTSQANWTPVAVPALWQTV